MFVERTQNQVPQLVLGRRIAGRSKERKAPPLAVHRVLTSGKRDIAPPGFSLPDPEPDELEPIERAAGEMQLCVRQLAGRTALVVRKELHRHVRASNRA